MSRNTWIIFTTIVVLLFGGLVFMSLKNRVDVSNVDETTVLEESEASGKIADHVYGNKNSKVVLIEYGDYQCPGCESAYQPTKTLAEKNKDKIAFVFRNFPLTNLHPNAKAAAATAEAAGIMGKYWQMHDLLYERQNDWSSVSGTDRTDLFANYAVELGLDREKFMDTLENNNDQINQKINFDLALGQKAGVSGTPTFYLNGKEVTEQVKDGKLVDASDSEANNIWADADAFDKLLIQPALKDAGLLNSKKK